jgi:hypothetical protein
MDQVIGIMFVIMVIGLLADKLLFEPWERSCTIAREPISSSKRALSYGDYVRLAKPRFEDFASIRRPRLKVFQWRLARLLDLVAFTDNLNRATA